MNLLPGCGRDRLRAEGADVAGRQPSTLLRICFFSHSAYLSGAERTLLELVTQLIALHGVECCVVVPGTGPLHTKLLEVGAEVVLGNYDWWCVVGDDFGSSRASRLVAQIKSLLDDLVPKITAFRPDVVCTQTIAIPFGALVAAEISRPHIWCLREYGMADGFSFCLSFDRIKRFIQESSDFVFGPNTKLCRELLPTLAPERHDVLYPSFDLVATEPINRVGTMTPKDTRFRIAEFSTIARERSLETAIGAVSHLRDRGHDIQYLLAGMQDPAYLKELIALAESLGISNRVVVEGFMDQVEDAMAETDCVVVSTAVHGFGRTCVEGMLLGKPVVYPLGTGFDDYIDDGRTGLGYTPRNSASMANAIELLIGNPELSSRIGREARETVRTKFTKHQFSGKFFEKAQEVRDRGPLRHRAHLRGFFDEIVASSCR